MSTDSCSSGCTPAPCADALALTALGTPGPEGPPGSTSTLYIGTVTTGVTAAASLTLVQASPPIYRLDLTLPVGTTQIYTTTQTFNALVTFNGAITSNGTNTWNGPQNVVGVATFSGNVFFDGVPEAADADCINGHLVLVNGQVKYTQALYNTQYTGSSVVSVTKAFDSVTETAFGPTVSFATACATSGEITLYMVFRNPGADAGTPTALSYYTIFIYDGATLISSEDVSNYQGGGVRTFPINFAIGNHSINFKVAGANFGDTGGQLQILSSTARVDV